MKKLLFLALLLTVAMFALSACNRNGGTDTSDPADTGTTSGTTPPANQPGETQPPAEIEQPVQAPEGTRASILASLEDWPAPTGYIINAHHTRPDTNMLHAAWGNAQPNAHARTLMNDLPTMARNTGNEFFPNPMVMVNGDWPEIRDNPDGTRTFTFTVYTENQFSDGTFINASHYAANIAFLTSHQWGEVVPSVFDLMHLHHRTDWLAGNIDVLPSVRIYNESQFSVTKGAAYVPNVWQTALHMNYNPLPFHQYNIEVHDDGEGVFFTTVGRDYFCVESLRAVVYGTNVGYETDAEGEYRLDSNGDRIPYGDGLRYRPRVFAGPYMFENLDVGNGVLTLVANPYFPGTWDGYRPRIERVIWRLTPSTLAVDAVASGDAHIMEAIQDGVAIEGAMEVLVGGGTHSFIHFDQFGQLFTQFHTDTGPTQFREVRQALSYLQDRHEMNEFVGRGFSVVAHGPWSPAWWWYQEAADLDLYDRITIYDFNMARAIELLEEGGWVYNADGSPFVHGVDTLRHKLVDDWEWGRDDNGDIVRVLADEDGNLLRSNKVPTGEQVYMPLIINWMVRAVPYPFRDAVELQLFDNLEYAGGLLIQDRNDGWSPFLSGGYRQADRFEMHTLGIGMGNPWTPWMNFSLDAIPAQNWGQVDNPETRALADAFITMDYVNRRDEFIEHFIVWMEHLTYEAYTLPFMMALVHDFFPVDLGNWYNNGIWTFPQAVQRAYWR